MEFLSKEVIRLDNKMRFNILYDFSEELNKLGWADFGSSRVTTSPSSAYCMIGGSATNALFFDKKSFCEIRKITNGYLAGRYCIVEFNGGFAQAYAVNEKEFLKLPYVPASNIQDLDQYFSKESLIKMTQNSLSVFDVSKNHQNYETFCENLPKACFKDARFMRTITPILFDVERLNIKGVANKRFVNSSLINEEIRRYFNNLAKIKAPEKEKAI